MRCSDNYEKYIYCLEGSWHKTPRSNQSVKPILELLNTFHKVKYSYRRCLTKDEFINGLRTFTHKRYSKYTILYVAYHGLKNGIYIGKEFITLKEIANVLEGKLYSKIVHFGSCSTLRTAEANILNFINRTDCSLISGYKKDVGYIDSSAFELLYFEALQKYRSLGKMKVAVEEKYSKLISALRFVMS